ncbi:AAA family ATPase [Candidatus Magnetaquicoccus inordinatus]|uniref:AAA family ATPase n=1 Tax=Candidatus Magnetaquicoccus inordinatus TaxID=2496818 RepID=UPI00102BBCA0|nr:AAA family ATPase [Candidatus Magnetaquicoccus inordinatus]
MFTKLELTNFTAFEHLDIEFSPGINVLVGANGTGKTHLMKLLYCIQDSLLPLKSLEKKLKTVFRPRNEDLHRLTRRNQGGTRTEITAQWNDMLFEFVRPVNFFWYDNSNQFFSESAILDHIESPVFIPVKEFLSFAPGFISLYDKYSLNFDEVYYDILKLAYLPKRKGGLDKQDQEILETIQSLIGGQVVTEGESFFLSQGNSNLEMHLVAEGYRKLALIWQLINNGSLSKGNTLFWDEPEANLNPSMMQYVAKILLLLAQRGIQIFVATHNYAFLKEIDLQKEETPVTYFALNDTGKNGVEVCSSSSYSTIYPNKIADEYLRLYDQEIQKSFNGGLK